MNKLILYFAAVSSMLVSCSTEIFDETEEIESGTHFLKVSTVSPDDEVLYPVHVYAYDASGDEVSTLDINSASDDLSMELSTGTYTIAAVSGSTDFSKGYNTVPLMLAKSNVTITTKDVDATLAMNYAVARLSVALSDVPEGIQDVTVTVSSLYNKVTPLNDLSESKPVTLSCVYDDESGLWKTDTVYVLPSDGNVTFTIEIKDEKNSSKKYSYEYEYKAKLLAATPYYFKGSYDSGEVNAKVTLTLAAAKWNEAVVENFSFGEGVNNNNNNQSSSDAAVFNVDEMPAPCSVWDGHVVATVDDDGNALLFSLKEWGPINYINDVYSEIVEYKEDEVTGWNVPTEGQTQILCDLYKQSGVYGNVALDNLLNSLSASKLHYEKTADVDGYLFQDETREYNFNLGNIRTKKAQNHYLRLVKPVKFIKNN
ncbi:MAG: hypothetical protein IJ199_03440 [Prevotella sp.]|nr:hypothetical protein [Prevotella sp.]